MEIKNLLFEEANATTKSLEYFKLVMGKLQNYYTESNREINALSGDQYWSNSKINEIAVFTKTSW